jgi:hypothetical protein
MATHSIPIPEAIKMFFDMSDLVHYAARFVPGHTVILMQLRGVRMLATTLTLPTLCEQTHSFLKPTLSTLAEICDT